MISNKQMMQRMHNRATARESHHFQSLLEKIIGIKKE